MRLSGPFSRAGMGASGSHHWRLEPMEERPNYDPPHRPRQTRRQTQWTDPEQPFQDDRGRIWISTNAGVGYLENDPCMASPRTRREVYGLPTRLAVFFIMVVPLRGTHGGATPNTQSSLPEGQPGE
jgi:hypothetical protein